MSIVAYVGLPGSGKSYGVVQHQILPALRAGRRVVTNIPMRVDLLTECYPRGELVQVTNDEVKEAGFFGSDLAGSVLVLDEVWRFWPAGTQTKAIPEEVRSFFAEHRHMVDDSGNTTQIVLVTQDLAQCASFVRQLVETTYRAVKLSAFGVSKRYKVEVYNGSITGSPPKTKIINTLFGKYHPSVYKFYSSATKSATGDVGNEKGNDTRASIWKSSPVLLMLVAPFVIFWASSRVLAFFEDGMHAGKTEMQPARHEAPAVRQAPAHVPGAVPAVPAAPPPDEPKGPQPSKQWRLAGFLGGWAVLETEGRVIRRIPEPECDVHGDLYESRCVVDGEIVAAWTGPQLVRGRAKVRTDSTGQVMPEG